MVTLEFQNNRIKIDGISFYDKYKFGTLQEHVTSAKNQPKIKEVRNNWSKLLIVGESCWYINTVEKLAVWDDNGNQIDVSSIEVDKIEEARLTSFMDALGVGSNISATIVHFTDSYCFDCWTNRGCKLHGCGRICSWGSFICKKQP